MASTAMSLATELRQKTLSNIGSGNKRQLPACNIDTYHRMIVYAAIAEDRHAGRKHLVCFWRRMWAKIE